MDAFGRVWTALDVHKASGLSDLAVNRNKEY